MDEGLMKDPKLLREYEGAFDNEEKIVNFLKLDSGKFSIELGVVYFDDFFKPVENGKERDIYRFDEEYRRTWYLGANSCHGN